MAIMTAFTVLFCQEPGNLSYASAGIGPQGHLTAMLFAKREGLSIEHIPYKGSGQAMTDLAAGIVDFAFDQEPSVKGFIDGKQVKALGIADNKRSDTLPNVPTLREQEVDITASAWAGVCVKKGTPPEVVKRIEDAVLKVMPDPQVKEKMAQLGITPMNLSTQALQERVVKEKQSYGALIKEAGIQPQ